MAKILNIEIETARLRVAETDSRGTRLYQCFSLPVPRGAVDDGQVRDTKTLGSMLKTLLEEKEDPYQKGIFCSRIIQDRQQGSQDPSDQEEPDPGYDPGKRHRVFSD